MYVVTKRAFLANRTLELDETRRWTEGGALEVVLWLQASLMKFVS